MKPSQALPRQLSQRESQAVKFITKVLGIMRRFPAVLLALPLRKDFPRSGGRCRAATKGGIWQARQGLTERAHAVSPITKISDAIRNSPAKTEGVSPQRRAFAESGAANAVDHYDPTCENAMPERPQTLRHCSIKNNSSSDYAQSNAERISNRLSSAPQGLRAGSPRGRWCVPRDGSPRRRPARSWSEWGLPARTPAPRTAPRCAPCGRPTARRR